MAHRYRQHLSAVFVVMTFLAGNAALAGSPEIHLQLEMKSQGFRQEFDKENVKLDLFPAVVAASFESALPIFHFVITPAPIAIRVTFQDQDDAVPWPAGVLELQVQRVIDGNVSGSPVAIDIRPGHESKRILDDNKWLTKKLDQNIPYNWASWKAIFVDFPFEAEGRISSDGKRAAVSLDSPRTKILVTNYPLPRAAFSFRQASSSVYMLSCWQFGGWESRITAGPSINNEQIEKRSCPDPDMTGSLLPPFRTQLRLERWWH